MSKRLSWAVLSALVLLSACGRAPSNDVRPVDDKGAEKPDMDPFLAVNRTLVAHSCSNCHAADYARVGPSMRDVAMIYEKATDEDRARLRDAIVNGTKGRWGMAIMPAQRQVTPQKADAIVAEILALKDVKASEKPPR